MRLFIGCDCDIAVAHVWVPYPFVAIANVSIQITVAPCEQTALNCKKRLSKNAVAKEINLTV